MTPTDGNGRQGPDEHDARAAYHRVLADAQALFLLLLGPPAPTEIVFGAIEALIADVELAAALPGQSQTRTELEHAVGIVTEQATILAPSPRAPSLSAHRQALRRAMGDIDRLVAELDAELPRLPILRRWRSLIGSALRKVMDKLRRPIGPRPRRGRRGWTIPPGRGPDAHDLPPSPPSGRVWRVVCSSCGWAPSTDATIYLDGTSTSRRTSGDGCLRDMALTVRGRRPPSRVEIVGQQLPGVSPEIDCSVVDITPYPP